MWDFTSHLYSNKKVAEGSNSVASGKEFNGLALIGGGEIGSGAIGLGFEDQTKFQILY